MTPLDAFPAALLRWQNFYTLSGEAAATLTGLMFVAVTFGSSLVKKETMRAARAFLDPTVMHFAQVVVVGCVMNIPTIDAGVLGVTLLVFGAFRLVGLAWVFLRYLEVQRVSSDIELSDWLGGIVAPGICHVVLALTGVGFWLRYAEAFTSLALVTIGTLVTALYCAWEQLVWMAVVVQERRASAPEPNEPKPPR